MCNWKILMYYPNPSFKSPELVKYDIMQHIILYVKGLPGNHQVCSYMVLIEIEYVNLVVVMLSVSIISHVRLPVAAERRRIISG